MKALNGIFKRKNTNKIKEKGRKVRKKFQIVAITFCAIVVLLCIFSSEDLDSKVHSYLSSKEDKVLEAFLDDDTIRTSNECYEWYEKNFLGITNNEALMCNGISDDGKTNYNNKIGKIKIYENTKQDTLVLEGNEGKSILHKGKVGEVIATKKKVYYINRNHKNILESITIQTKENKQLTKEGVLSFAILGNTILYLNESQELVYLDEKDLSKEVLATNIQRFCVGDQIVAQNDKQIISISYDGKKIEKYVDNAILGGYKENEVYYCKLPKSEGGMFQLYKMNTKTKSSEMLKEEKSFINAVYFVDNKMIVDTI